MFCFICLTGRVSHHVCWFVPRWENISISSSCSWFYWWKKGTGHGEVDRAGVFSVSEFSCLLGPSSSFSFQSLPSAAQVGLQWSMETLNWIYKERDWGNLGEAGWQGLREFGRGRVAADTRQESTGVGMWRDKWKPSEKRHGKF